MQEYPKRGRTASSSLRDDREGLGKLQWMLCREPLMTQIMNRTINSAAIPWIFNWLFSQERKLETTRGEEKYS